MEVKEEDRAKPAAPPGEESVAERYRLLAENIQDIVCQLGPQGNIEYVSPSIRFALGHNVPELTGRSIYGLLHPEDRERAEADFQRFSRSGTRENLEYRVRHANGEYRWMEVTARPVFDRDFCLAGIVISARDISELKQAREEAARLRQQSVAELETKTSGLLATVESLREEISERKKADQERAEAFHRQEAIMRVMPVVLYSAQLRTPFAAVWMSDNVGYVTGYPLERFLREPGFWMERVHPDDRETVEKYLEQVSSGKILQTEYRWQCADGEYHWFLDQVVNVQLSESSVTEYFGIWIDITGRKDIKRKVDKAKKR